MSHLHNVSPPLLFRVIHSLDSSDFAEVYIYPSVIFYLGDVYVYSSRKADCLAPVDQVVINKIL